MSSIVYRTVNGTKYAYSSESYWDPEKKAPRTKRKYLGKVDEDGNIIRVYKARGEGKEADNSPEGTGDFPGKDALLAEIEKLKEEVQELREQNSFMNETIMAMKRILDTVS